MADCNTPKKISCRCCTQCYGLYTTNKETSAHKLDCLSSEIKIDFDYSQTLETAYNNYNLLDNARDHVIRDFELTKTASSHHMCISSTDCFTLIFQNEAFGNYISFEMAVYVDGNEVISKTVKGDESLTFGYSNNSMILNRCDPYQVCGISFEPSAVKREVVNKMIGYLNSTLLKNNTSAQSKVLCEWAKYVDSAIPDYQISYNLIQRYILMLFYYSTNGPRWLINSLWLSDESECLWYGVTCNEYNIVVSLDLRSNKLSGPIPSEIGELKGLESLTLSDNRINGLIPQEIEKLEALKTLNISNNALKENIPTQIINLHSLIELDLSFNTLSGRIPNDIGELKNILRMDLSNNLFSDQLPDQIYNLKKYSASLLATTYSLEI